MWSISVKIMVISVRQKKCYLSSALSQNEKIFAWYEKRFSQWHVKNYSKWGIMCLFWVFFSQNENQEFAV